VLSDWTFDTEPSQRQWNALQSSLRQTLFAKRFDLRWPADYGLAVAALCFGMEPEEVHDHWKIIWRLARPESNGNADIMVSVDDSVKVAALAIVVAYLASNPLKVVENPEELPATVDISLDMLPKEVLAWVHFGLQVCRAMNLNPSSLTETITLLAGLPDDAPVDRPRLFIEVMPNTTEEDLHRIWPIAAVKQLTLWGPAGKQPRLTRTWWRDHELYALFKQFGNLADVVREYDKRHPEARLNTDDNYTEVDPAAIDIVRKAIRRVEKSLSASEPKKKA
jgi:hypothetical protein